MRCTAVPSSAPQRVNRSCPSLRERRLPFGERLLDDRVVIGLLEAILASFSSGSRIEIAFQTLRTASPDTMPYHWKAASSFPATCDRAPRRPGNSHSAANRMMSSIEAVLSTLHRMHDGVSRSPAWCWDWPSRNRSGIEAIGQIWPADRRLGAFLGAAIGQHVAEAACLPCVDRRIEIDDRIELVTRFHRGDCRECRCRPRLKLASL